MSNTSPCISRKANPEGLTLSHALYRMSLLGHRAWHLPDWLDRILPDIDLDGHRDSGQHQGAVGDSTVAKAGAR